MHPTSIINPNQLGLPPPYLIGSWTSKENKMPKTAKKAAPAKRAMPKFMPAPEGLKTRFAEIIARYPEAEPRKMFGYPAAFINDQMFFGTFGDALMMRLSE